jgi:SP family general alpha glucoside:H+ symporter-like MFS transporter
MYHCLGQYINEHAPTTLRGLLVVAYSLWFTAGGLFGAVALKARATTHPMDFRNMIYTQFAMIGLSAVIFFFLPESPWWLVSKGKNEQAKKILASKFSNVPQYDVETEFAIIEATIENQREFDKASKSEGSLAMLKGLNLKRFLIGSFPKVLQQFVGLSIFSSYSSYFFQLAGNKDPFMGKCFFIVCNREDRVLIGPWRHSYRHLELLRNVGCHLRCLAR